jgi:hypothetical protein
MKQSTWKQKTQKISVLLFGLTLLLLNAASISFAQDITLAWDVNQESDVAFYNVYFKDIETQETWQEPGPVHDPSSNVASYQILGLDGTRQHCFTVTALTDSGVESSPSEEVCTTDAPAAATGAMLTPNVASPQAVGSSVVFTAGGTGGSGSYEYRFWLRSGGVWAIAQDYSTSNTWTWDTTGLTADSYGVVVYVRSVGSTAGYEAARFINYVLLPPATGATLVPDLASPQPVGTSPIVFTAGGTGGSGT